MYVKPKPGVIVRDPHTKKPVPPEGREVPDERYWQRRVRDGDLVLAEPPPPPPAAA